jgi:transposase
LASEDPGLAVVNPDAAGIDIGNRSHFVAVPPGRDAESIREFGCWTADLQRMGEWLKQCGIKTVAMQSTGVYWIAAYDQLRQQGLEVYLVNAHGTKNLPGRKSDVQESQWLMKLHTYGLLRGSFQPSEAIEKIRTIWRLRDRHVKEAGRSVQHMQKALTKMNIQLANAISDISGVTGQKIIRAIVDGERDGRALARLRHGTIQASEEEIAHSLQGRWREDLLFELEQAVKDYDHHHEQMKECDRELKKYLGAIEPAKRETAPAKVEAKVEEDAGQVRKRQRTKARKARANQPEFDLQGELQRIFGVDLTRIDGIDVMTAQMVLSEVGPDVSAWKSEAHWASWLTLSPQREISGGKVIRHTRPPAHNRLGQAFRMAATSLLRSESYLGAQFRHLRARLGGLKAVKAMARRLACLVYRLLTQGAEYIDRGREHFERKRQQRELAALQTKAASHGMRLVAAQSGRALPAH